MSLRRCSIRAVVGFGAVFALTLVESVSTEGQERLDDFSIVIENDVSHPPNILPENAIDAAYTFRFRASKILQFGACRSEPPFTPTKGFIGVFNTSFDLNCPGGTITAGQCSNSATAFYGFESWGHDALAKLAYTGDCPTNLAGGGGGTAEQRYAAVDAVLAQINVDPNANLGTTIPQEKYAGVLEVQRNGDLDTGLKELIPIVYLFKSKIPTSYCHLLDFLSQDVGNNNLIIGNPPNFGLYFGSLGSATIPETENHTLAELSEQYLVNQLFNQDYAKYCAAGRQMPSPAAFDNTNVHGYLMTLLQDILKSDLFEYNSKPYNHYALYAMENLADFAYDPDISTAAKEILDFEAAKFAISSSLIRRSSPYRRRGSMDGNFFNGSEADAQTCSFYLYTGQLQTTEINGEFALDEGCTSAIREVVSAYRIPNVVVNIAINKTPPYLQTFSGGPSYYSALYGNDANYGNAVGGPIEVYDNEGSFLIAAGGVPQPNGLPGFVHLSTTADIGAYLSGLISGAFAGGLFSGAAVGLVTGPAAEIALNAAVSGPGPDGARYSLSDEDVGISLPTLLIPYDPVRNGSPVDHPIVDRTRFVRIEGTGHGDVNLCVAPGFACGKNPLMPLTMPPCAAPAATPPQVDCIVTSGPFQFAIIPTLPVATYVAMLSESVPLYRAINTEFSLNVPLGLAPFSIGFFDAEVANNFHSFQDYQNRIEANNPSGAGLIVEIGTKRLSSTDFSCLTAGLKLTPPLIVNAPCFVVTGWKGHFTKADTTSVDFSIPGLIPPMPLPYDAVYSVQSTSFQLPKSDPNAWDLADGPILANHIGNITITDQWTGYACQLNITNASSPTRSCNDLTFNQQHNGFMTQGMAGQLESFAMIVPEGDNLAFYQRNAPGSTWQRGSDVLSAPSNVSQDKWVVNGASLLQNAGGNLEAVAWVHKTGFSSFAPGVVPVTDYLEYFTYDPSASNWTGGNTMIMADGKVIAGVTGPPAVIQELLGGTVQGTYPTLYGSQGKFDMVVPEGGTLAFYQRNNGAPGSAWQRGSDVLSAPSNVSQDKWVVNGATLLQDAGGNLEAVAWVHRTSFSSFAPGVVPVADYLEYFTYDPSTSNWTGGNTMMMADGKVIAGVTGAPSFIQSAFGWRGNLEMVVPEGGQLVNYWRDNDVSGFPWHEGATIIAASPSVSEDRWTVKAATMLQSTSTGNLEVVAWVHQSSFSSVVRGGPAPSPDYLEYSYLDRSTLNWSAPTKLSAGNIAITNISGPQ